MHCYAPYPIAMRVGLLFDVCPTSVAYIWPKSRTKKPRKTKIGTEGAHVTRDSDTTFKAKRSTCRGGGISWRPPAQLVSIIIRLSLTLPLRDALKRPWCRYTNQQPTDSILTNVLQLHSLRTSQQNKLFGWPAQYAPAQACKLIISLYLFVRWHLFRDVGYLRHQQQVELWPLDLESGVRVTCNVGYLYANFSLPRPLCSRVRPDVRDWQTDRRQTKASLMPPSYGGGSIMIRVRAAWRILRFPADFWAIRCLGRD